MLMEKLNYLIGLCYPNYTNETQLMMTPFIELTLGDMFVDASGLLSGLTVTVEDTTTWELDDGLQFPHYIKAACEFKYIGNNKLSSTSSKHYNGLNPGREYLEKAALAREAHDIIHDEAWD